MALSEQNFQQNFQQNFRRPGQPARRDLLSVNMRSSGMDLVELRQLSTYMASLPLETGTLALRIGLANNSPTPYAIGGVCACEAAGWQPAPAARWVHFRFAGAAPGPVTVPGNAARTTGARNVPAILWSDWLDFRTGAAGRPQLLLRALVPPQTLPMAYVAQERGGKRLLDQAMVEGDFVRAPGTRLPSLLPANRCPVFAVQYRAATAGHQMVIGGDSHMAVWNNFAQLAARQLSTPAAPLSVWNAAWSGQNSKTFWPALADAMADAVPSIAVIQGWTANDGMTARADAAYLTRVRESAIQVLAAGGVPVIVKPLPRDLAGRPALTSWQATGKQLDRLLPGAYVFDPSPYAEDTAKPGNWLAGLSDDGVHPNIKASMVLSRPFKDLLNSILN